MRDELSADGAARGCLQATGDVRGRWISWWRLSQRQQRAEGQRAKASKVVSPTGAQARKKSTGSVDGVDRKVDSRGDEARTTDRRTEAGVG